MSKTALTILAVASTLVLGGMVRANAATSLDFVFSFSNSLGTVTGEVDDLLNDNNGPASAVILDSFPAALGTICSTPCNMVASPWVNVENIFSVFNDQLLLADFISSNQIGTFIFEQRFLGSLTTVDGRVLGDATFTLVPLPAALPLFATGLGALGLLGWRRKRKSRVSLLGAA